MLREVLELDGRSTNFTKEFIFSFNFSRHRSFNVVWRILSQHLYFFRNMEREAIEAVINVGIETLRKIGPLLTKIIDIHDHDGQ